MIEAHHLTEPECSKIQDELLARFWPVLLGVGLGEGYGQWYVAAQFRSGRTEQFRGSSLHEVYLCVDMHAANECEYEEGEGENPHHCI